MVSPAIMANAPSSTATAADQLVQHARYFVETHNATTIAYTGSLALGTLLVILSLFLYYVYQTEQANNGRSGGQWQYGEGNDKNYKDEGFQNILDLLEKSWLLYGVQDQRCRRRLACEAHLANAKEINEAVSDTLKGLISQVKDGILTSTSTPDNIDKTAVRDLLLAAKHGQDWNDCLTYLQLCPTVSLAALPQDADDDHETLVPQNIN